MPKAEAAGTPSRYTPDKLSPGTPQLRARHAAAERSERHGAQAGPGWI